MLANLCGEIITDFVGIENPVDRRRVISLCCIRQNCEGISRAVLVMPPPQIATRHHAAAQEQQYHRDDSEDPTDSTRATCARATLLISTNFVEIDHDAVPP